MSNAPTPTQNQAPPGDRPGPRLLEFKAVRKNTLRGFAAVKLPNGLVITDIPVNQVGGKARALLPGKPMVDRDGNLMRDERDGRVRYSKVMEWSTPALRDGFSERVVTLVRAQYPDALDQPPALGGGTP